MKIIELLADDSILLGVKAETKEDVPINIAEEV